MKNYFNAIGVADMEKVHSAMIAWILDDSNDLTLSSPSSSTSNFSTFDLQERSRLLCDLFGVTPARTFKSIISHVEWNDIDIMIETTDNNNVNEIWVIENKLKSQEHMSNVKNTNGISSIWQTLKYEIIIDSSFPKLSKHFMLLSLGGDKAKSSSGRWHAYKYDGIQNLLLSVASIKNHVLIEEYANAVSEMTQELSKFLNASDYRNYPNVFKKIKKSQKTTSLQQNKVKPTEKYIVENGLETIFQKQLLAKLVKDKLPQICNSVHYDERNGIAMFVCPVCCIGNDYDLSIEFQGGTYKVALLHKDYMDANSSTHTPYLYGTWNNVNKTGTGKVYIEFCRLPKKSNKWKVAVSKNLGSGKAKPRIALDKNIGNNWYNNLNNPNSLFVSVFNEAMNLAKIIQQNIKSIP